MRHVETCLIGVRRHVEPQVLANGICFAVWNWPDFTIEKEAT